MSEPVDLAEFLPAYLGEVGELLTAAQQHVLAVESAHRTGGHAPRAVRELFRAVHTIKGLSAMIDVEPIVELAHRMEVSLRTADRAGGRLAASSIEPLVQGLRAIEQRVRSLAAGKQVSPAPEDLLEALEQLEGAERAEPSNTHLVLEPELLARVAPSEIEQLLQGVQQGRRAVRIDFTPSAERSAKGISITSLREAVSALGEIVKVLPVGGAEGVRFVLLVLTSASDDALQTAVGQMGDRVGVMAEPTAPSDADGAAVGEDGVYDDLSGSDEENDAPVMARKGVFRVEASRLDEALERLGALVVSRSRVQTAVAELTAMGLPTRELTSFMHENGRILRDLRAAILRLRMVRVSELLERVPLVLRSLRRASGKKVRLELDVGHAELDKAVADRLLPAIMHLVRNAVDHALESPEERRAAGKPEEGLLRIVALARTDSQLELRIEDDGRGVDARALATRARVPLPSDEAALLDLLCRPGLSSRDEATVTSGRGMGMDIVRRIVRDELGGQLQLTTREGLGTQFLLAVPLTISIIDALIFEVGQRRYAVPVRMVDELIEIDAQRIVRVPRGSGALGLIPRRGSSVSLLSLATLLGLPPTEGGGTRALVIRTGKELLAFAVDRMVAQQEVVVRPLEDPLLLAPGIAGATDLGDGRPTLVLDLGALSTRAPAKDNLKQGAA